MTPGAEPKKRGPGRPPADGIAPKDPASRQHLKACRDRARIAGLKVIRMQVDELHRAVALGAADGNPHSANLLGEHALATLRNAAISAHSMRNIDAETLAREVAEMDARLAAVLDKAAVTLEPFESDDEEDEEAPKTTH